MVKIISVAILKNGVIFSIPKPGRHSDVFNNLKGYLVGKGYDGKMPKQGFLTSEGKFVNREEAKIIAKNANQILNEKIVQKELFSEDLW